jgi:thioredoxin-related protein
MRKYYLILAAITLISCLYLMNCKSRYAALEEPKAPIHWENMDDAVAAANKDGKLIYIDFYTDWCGWCKRMDATTYRDTALIRVLNTHFHPVQFNAEKGNYVLNGKNYPMDGQFNLFAVEALNGEMAFPTSVILKANLDGMYKQAGYMDAITTRAITTFFGEKHYQKGENLNEFVQKFK